MADARTTPSTTGAGGDPLVASTALLDALFADAPVGLAFWDLELRFRRINSELVAINGVPLDGHLGRRPRDVLGQLGAEVEETLAGVLASGQPVHDLAVAGETPSAPGVTRHWLASYFPVRDDRGAPVGVAALVVEVTGERRAERRADEAQQRTAFVDAEMRGLYAALPVGVAFLDPELRYRRVNETLARMNGRSVADHIGASLQEVLGDAAGELADALRRVMSTRESLEVEISVPRPDDPDAVRAFEATYFPVLEGGDRLLGVGGVVRDVTERHELELEQSRLLHEALVSRAQAEASQVRADNAREEAERARADTERARERLAFLARAGQRMAASMDWETTLRTVVRSAVPFLADWSALTVVGPDGRLQVVAVAHRDPEREPLAWDLAERYHADREAQHGPAHVIRTGELELLSDIAPEQIAGAPLPADQLELMRSLGVRHTAVAPLRTPGGVIGALSFVLGDSGRRFTPADRDVITGLAGRAALHIHNARLYTERSHIAATLQEGLRPRALPVVPGAALAARYRPAGDQNAVGGDFYDAFASGEEVWTAIVADVSGKGPEAAAVTALVRHTLRAASMLHDDPGANLGLLNRALHAEWPAASFCTAFYARLCPGEGGLDLRFANGGHPAPLLLRTDGTVEAVEGGRGPLVGAIPDATFRESTLQLGPGELLLIYTDGVTEVRMSDIELGERELRATLAAHAGASAESVVAAVEARAVELQNGAPRDDIALLAIKACTEGDDAVTVRT